MADKWKNKKGDEKPKKLQLGHNMTTAARGIDRPILEGSYCGIREIPDFMELETARNHVGKPFCLTK